MRDKPQEKISAFLKENKLGCGINERMLDLISEAGEVSKEILKSTDYGKKSHTKTSQTEEELGDLYFSLLALAQELDVDLDTALDKTLQKYEKRIRESKSPESKDDKS